MKWQTWCNYTTIHSQTGYLQTLYTVYDTNRQQPLQSLILKKQTDKLLLLGIPGGLLPLSCKEETLLSRSLSGWLTQESLQSFCISIFLLIWCEACITDSHTSLCRVFGLWRRSCSHDARLITDSHFIFVLRAFKKLQERDDCAQDAGRPVTPVISRYGTVRIRHMTSHTRQRTKAHWFLPDGVRWWRLDR